jgi:hypothetical protein
MNHDPFQSNDSRFYRRRKDADARAARRSPLPRKEHERRAMKREKCAGVRSWNVSQRAKFIGR